MLDTINKYLTNNPITILEKLGNINEHGLNYVEYKEQLKRSGYVVRCISHRERLWAFRTNDVSVLLQIESDELRIWNDNIPVSLRFFNIK